MRDVVPSGHRFSKALSAASGQAFHPLYAGRYFIRYVGSYSIHSCSSATPVSLRMTRSRWAAACGVFERRASIAFMCFRFRSDTATSPNVSGSPSVTGQRRKRSAMRVCACCVSGSSSFHSGRIGNQNAPRRTKGGSAAVGSRCTSALTTGRPSIAAVYAASKLGCKPPHAPSGSAFSHRFL